MSKFYAQDGQFWLDDQPMLIQAGEFHYYRTPADQWAHRLGLLKSAGFNAVATYIPWCWHEIEAGVFDFDGHTHPMRDLQGYLDLAARMGLWIIPRPGPYIMAETINEGIPQWIFKQHPQVAFISQENKPHNIVSYLHPDFLSSVQRWYRGIFSVLAPRQVTRGGRILMVQLDNEMGMMHWVRNILDINPDTLTRFAAYLRQVYGEDLPARYPGPDLPAFLRAGILEPSAEYGARIVEDYRHFFRTYLHDYAQYLLDEAVSCGMEVPPVINIHGFANGGKTFPIGISQLVKVMEIPGMISATDVYPGHVDEGNFHQLLAVNEMTKALHNVQQPLFSIEFQAGGNHDYGGGQTSLYELHSRLCISSGMRAINHYLFCDGENDPLLSPVRRHDWGHPVRKDGSLRRHYHRYPLLSRVLDTYGKALVLAQPQPVTTIGFLIDHFMTEVNTELTRAATQALTHQRDVILFDFIARGLALTQRAFNAVELSRASLDPQTMPLLWVLVEKQFEAAAQQKLVNYAKQGGKLVLVGRLPVEDFQHKPCTLLKEALGVLKVRGGTPFAPEEISAFQHEHIPASFMETYTGDFDEVFARDENGATVGFITSLGQGKVMVFGAAMTANTLDDLDVLHQMALRMGCPASFELSEWADVRLSQGPDGNFLYINNYQDDPVELTIAWQGTLMLGGNPVHLAARSGAILPIEWQAAPGVRLHFSTSEIINKMVNEAKLVLETKGAEFEAELSISGWRLDPALEADPAGPGRFRLHAQRGEIVLWKE